MERVFRRAEPGDFPVIRRLLKHAYSLHLGAEPGYYKAVDEPLSIDNCNTRISNNHVFVLEVDERVVGFVFIDEKEINGDPLLVDQRILYIDDMCVEQTERRKGYGETLFREIVQHAQGIGCKIVELNVWEFNEAAKQFSQKMHMRKTRTRMAFEIG